MAKFAPVLLPARLAIVADYSNCSYLQIVRGDVTGACIRATSSRLNYGAILFNESGHVEEASNVLPQKSEAAMHFRIVLAYARAWPHKDTNKPKQEIVMDLFRTSHDALCLIDNNHPAARQKGEGSVSCVRDDG